VVEKPGFKGNGKTLKAQYSVINPKSQSRREKIFELTRKQAATIKNGLEPDKTIYKVWKTGTGTDTQYHVEAIR
jgi:hypothetical protein